MARLAWRLALAKTGWIANSVRLNYAGTTRITTFPTCFWLSKCAYASIASSNEKTLSMTGRVDSGWACKSRFIDLNLKFSSTSAEEGEEKERKLTVRQNQLQCLAEILSFSCMLRWNPSEQTGSGPQNQSYGWTLHTVQPKSISRGYRVLRPANSSRRSGKEESIRTSRIWSTPLPSVSFRTSLSQSGVVL